MSDNINVTPQYLLAGEATVTVSNQQGVHFTYHVYKAHPTDQYPGPAWFIKMLIGSNDDYKYMGAVVPMLNRSPTIKLTGRSKFREGDKSVAVARWMFRAVWQHANRGYRIPAGMSIKHIGKCGRCGRKLTNPASLDTGVGPECADQLGIEWREREQRQPRLEGVAQ